MIAAFQSYFFWHFSIITVHLCIDNRFIISSSDIPIFRAILDVIWSPPLFTKFFYLPPPRLNSVWNLFCLHFSNIDIHLNSSKFYLIGRDYLNFGAKKREKILLFDIFCKFIASILSCYLDGSEILWGESTIECIDFGFFKIREYK